MKIAVTLFSIIMLIIPAYTTHAQDVPEKEHNRYDKQQQVGELIHCQAVDITLGHLYTQIAASMIALTGPKNITQFKPLIDSYKELAKDQKAKSKTISSTILTIINQFPADEQNGTKNGIMQMLGEAMIDITHTLGNPSHELGDQVRIEKILAVTSNSCETFTTKTIERNTY